VASSLDPKRFGSPVLSQTQKKIFSMPERNDFILCAVYDEYRTPNVGCVVDVGKSAYAMIVLEKSECELIEYLMYQQPNHHDNRTSCFQKARTDPRPW
jgi:hypothetical protein